MERQDPTVIRSIAVTVDDILAAFEANRQRDAGTVLRITPPFAGRMRARIHREAATRGTDVFEAVADSDEPRSIHVEPVQFLDDDVASAYPMPDETADDLRADPDETYTRTRHREYHERAVASWRQDARDAVVDAVTLQTPKGPNDVTVKPLD